MYCGVYSETYFKKESTMATHVFAFLCCVFLCAPCIPYYLKACKEENEFCKNCNIYIRTIRKIKM